MSDDFKGHTQGPWVVRTDSTGYLNQVGIDPAIGCAYGAGEEVQANARLIAAAPDLLAERNRLRAENEALRTELSAAIARAEKAEAERNELRAELDRLTTLRPASAWDGETYVLWWHEFDDAGWAPVAISNIQATSHWTPVFDAQVQRAGGCVNSLHSEASTSGREPAHPIPTPKEPTP